MNALTRSLAILSLLAGVATLALADRDDKVFKLGNGREAVIPGSTVREAKRIQKSLDSDPEKRAERAGKELFARLRNRGFDGDLANQARTEVGAEFTRVRQGSLLDVLATVALWEAIDRQAGEAKSKDRDNSGSNDDRERDRKQVEWARREIDKTRGDLIRRAKDLNMRLEEKPRTPKNKGVAWPTGYPILATKGASISSYNSDMVQETYSYLLQQESDLRKYSDDLGSRRSDRRGIAVGENTSEIQKLNRLIGALTQLTRRTVDVPDRAIRGIN